MKQTSDGTLLAGRLHYTQPAKGYRTGIEPVLLAAAVPARPGERVIEAGTGAGAGLLCLSARLPGVVAIGIERDADLAALASRNLAANGFASAAVLTAALAEVSASAIGGVADHGMANPPWHDAAGTPSPNPTREAAKRATAGLLGDWATSLARLLRPRGTLSTILPAEQFTSAAQALRGAGFGAISLFPLWPRQGVAARFIILRGSKAARGADRVHAGLALHDGAGFSDAAEAVLRNGAALRW